MTFTDVTVYQRLKNQEDHSKLLETINTNVHHEMLSPLGANVYIAETLHQRLEDPELKEYVQAILVASKLVLLHANDLMDKDIMRSGKLLPSYKFQSVTQAVREIV